MQIKCGTYSSALVHKNIYFPLSFLPRRVQVDGSVDDHPVSNITVDSATYRCVRCLASLVKVPPFGFLFFLDSR